MSRNLNFTTVKVSTRPVLTKKNKVFFVHGDKYDGVVTLSPTTRVIQITLDAAFIRIGIDAEEDYAYEK